MAWKISRGIRAVLGERGERGSLVAIRVDDHYLGIGCRFHASRHFYCASTVKVTIIAAGCTRRMFKAEASPRARRASRGG
jgi:hypothetical protein